MILNFSVFILKIIFTFKSLSKNIKEFQLSIYQTLVLLLFESKDEVGYDEINESTKIGNNMIFRSFVPIIWLYGLVSEESELKRTLQSLACGKYIILNKSSKVFLKKPSARTQILRTCFFKGVDVQSTDMFKFNKSFTHKLYRVKINQVQMKETVIWSQWV